MDSRILIILSCLILMTSGWSRRPYYPLPRRPMRFTRFAPPPPGPPQPHLPSYLLQRPHPHKIPAEQPELEKPQWERPKRGHRDEYDHDDDHDHEYGRKSTSGVTGPVHTFVKTDKNANYKWGVRHHVGNKYAS